MRLLCICLLMRQLKRRALPVTALVLSLSMAGAAPSSQAVQAPVYLALGDSVAVGVGASDPEVGGYTALVWEGLRETTRYQESGLEYVNLAVSGETTDSMLAEGGQLEKALALLRERNGDGNAGGDVEVVTLTIGGNDILRLLRGSSPCVPDPDSVRCQEELDRTLARLEANLSLILSELREAAGDRVKLFVMGYYNPFSGTGVAFDDAGDEAIMRVNDVIEQTATAPGVDAVLVDVAPVFLERGPQLSHINRLDIHPNDAGYRAIADAFLAAIVPALQQSAIGDDAIGMIAADGVVWWLYGVIGAVGAALLTGVAAFVVWRWRRA